MSELLCMSLQVAGVTFEGRQELLKSIKKLTDKKNKKLELILEQEPNNKYDPNAIKVIANIDAGYLLNSDIKYNIGYVPKEMNKLVNDMINNKEKSHYKLTNARVIGGENNKNYGMYAELFVDKNYITEYNKKKS